MTERRTGAPPLLKTSDALPAIADDVPVPRLRRLLYQAALLPLGMMLLLCVLLAWQVAALVDENEVVAYSQRVIGEAHQVQKLLIDHETGMRGYMLTGDQEFLQPYRFGRSHLPGRLDRLHGLVEGRPDQRARVEAIDAAYREWVSSAEAQPADAALLRAPTDAGALAGLRERKQRMDAMRQLSAEVLESEAALLREREDRAARQRRLTIGGGIVLLMAFGAFMATFMRRWFRTMEHIYAKALARRFQSEAGERAARQAAEALADEITAQSRELEARLRTLRRELATARADPRDA